VRATGRPPISTLQAHGGGAIPRLAIEKRTFCRRYGSTSRGTTRERIESSTARLAGSAERLAGSAERLAGSAEPRRLGGQPDLGLGQPGGRPDLSGGPAGFGPTPENELTGEARAASNHIDGVTRAGSAGTKSRSRARSWVLLTMLAPVVENRTVQGSATARRCNCITTSTTSVGRPTIVAKRSVRLLTRARKQLWLSGLGGTAGEPSPLE
jgi:hypothetical protein